MTDLFWPPEVDDNEPQHAQPAYPSGGGGSEPPTPTRRAAAAPWRRTAAAAGLAALVFGGVGVGVGAAVADHGSGNGNASGLATTAAPGGAVASNPKSFAAIAARVLPSVASINVTTPSGGDTGSGIVLRSDGYILTNNHVVAAATGGGGTVNVIFNDGTSSTAKIVGADAEDDLAVLKVARTGLKAATLGSAAGVRVGDPVLALGSPLGLQGTVTSGIVSAVNRPVQTSDQSQDPFGGSQPATTTVLDAIQTDAAINPGNSGGPLVNAAGQVIGVNSAIASTGTTGGQSGNIGVGFAIPIDQAKVVAQQLITTGKASHPLLGVSLADATDSSGTALARVQAVSKNGPAAKAGLRPGDVIVQIGDQRTDGAEAVIAAVRAHQPGDRLPVTVLRNGARTTVTVTLADAANAQG